MRNSITPAPHRSVRGGSGCSAGTDRLVSRWLVRAGRYQLLLTHSEIFRLALATLPAGIGGEQDWRWLPVSSLAQIIDA